METINDPGVGMGVQQVQVNPRTFSKLKIALELRNRGAWPQVKAWLEANDYWDMFVLAQDIKEDDPNFSAGRAALARALGWTDEQTETLLAQCIAE